jgi:AcrR family transcriptional regulator
LADTIGLMASRGPYAKGLAKREEILAAALENFTRNGYDRASVREIARMAGISQAGLLHHFASKEELFLEVVKWRHVRDADRFPEPLPAIDTLIQAAEHNSREPGLVRLYVLISAESTGEDGPARDFFVDRYRRILRQLTEDVERRQSAGELPSDVDPADLASLLVAAADGLQVQWLLDPDSVDMPERLRRLWALLTRASTGSQPTD